MVLIFNNFTWCLANALIRCTSPSHDIEAKSWDLSVLIDKRHCGKNLHIYSSQSQLIPLTIHGDCTLYMYTTLLHCPEED